VSSGGLGPVRRFARTDISRCPCKRRDHRPLRNITLALGNDAAPVRLRSQRSRGSHLASGPISALPRHVGQALIWWQANRSFTQLFCANDLGPPLSGFAACRQRFCSTAPIIVIGHVKPGNHVGALGQPPQSQQRPPRQIRKLSCVLHRHYFFENNYCPRRNDRNYKFQLFEFLKHSKPT